MSVKKTVSAPIPPPVTGPSAALVAKAKKEGLALVPPLKTEVEEMVIESPEDLKRMDGLLSDIAGARKTWTAKLAPIRDPLKGAIKSAKAAGAAADALFNEVDKPLAELEITARRKMADYSTAERLRIQAAADEQQRIQREIEHQSAIEALGRTSAIRQKATATREQLEERQAEVFEAAPTPTQVEGSGGRAVKKIRVTDMARFLKFIASDIDTLGACVEVAQPALNRWLKEDPEGVKAWPGVEVYDDTVIVRRS